MYQKLSFILSVGLFGHLLWAEDVVFQDKSVYQLEDISVEGNRLYDLLPSEVDGAYTMDAATVGTKIPAALIDIPQSVSITTNKMMRDRNVATFDQLAIVTPGLRILANDEGRSSVFSRGYEYDAFNVDGLPAQMQSINGTLPSLVAFDRVEIMRGPSGLFNSSGEMGGIVNFVRKRPLKTFSGSLEGMLGNLHQYRATLDLGGGLNKDGSVRARGLVSANGKTPTVSHKSNHAEVVYGALDMDLNGRTSMGLGYLYQQRHLKPDNGLPVQANGRLFDLPNNDFYGAKWNHFQMDSHDFFADLKHAFENGAYGKIALRYSRRESLMNYAFSQSALDKNHQFTAAGLGGDVQQDALSFDASYSRPFKTWGNVSEYVVGVDSHRFSNDMQRGRSKFPKMTLNKLNDLAYQDILEKAQQSHKGYSHEKSTLTETGIYGKLTFRPINQLALIVGARLHSWQINNENFLTHKTLKRSEKARLTSYGGLVYHLSDIHSLYASYSSLYTPQSDTDLNGQLLKARQGRQYEIGIKGSYLTDSLQARLSLFTLKDKNAAINVPHQKYKAALGKRTIQGVEVEINGELTPNWQLSAGYTYTDAKVKAIKGSNQGIFTFMPKHLLNIWTSYRLPNRLTIATGITAMSHFASSQGVKTKGYATLDAMASYPISEKMNIQFNINNIFNRHYYKRVGSQGTFNMPGEERSFSATLHYQF